MEEETRVRGKKGGKRRKRQEGKRERERDGRQN